MEDFLVSEIGPVIEKYHLFLEKTNTIFVQTLNEDKIKLRILERGIRETIASKTGASIALVAGTRNKKIIRRLCLF